MTELLYVSVESKALLTATNDNLPCGHREFFVVAILWVNFQLHGAHRSFLVNLREVILVFEYLERIRMYVDIKNLKLNISIFV